MEDCERRHDFISCLPQDVLKRIVSLLPLEEGIRTSACSKTWRSIWFPVLLTCHEEIIQILSMSYDVHQIWKLVLTHGEDTIVSATKGVNQELRLEFSNMEEEYLGVDFHLKLRLLQTCSFSSFSNLKMLHLISVNRFGKDLISSLFAISKFLESLELEHCRGLQSLDIEANDNFKILKLLDCPDMVSLTISATNLRSFWYQGVLPRIRPNNTLDHLEEMVLDLRDGFCSINHQFDCEDVISFLNSLMEVQSLTLSSWLLEWLCSGGVIFSRLEFRFNKLKELICMDSGMNKNKRDSLACFLNICPSLEKLLIKIDPDLKSMATPFFHQFWHEPHLWMDDATVFSNTSNLENLKTVEIWGYENEEDEINLLIKLLLEKANMLKSVTVTSPPNHSWEILRNIIPESQLKQTWKTTSYLMYLTHMVKLFIVFTLNPFTFLSFISIKLG